MVPAEPGDHAQRDRAIAACHQRQPPGVELAGDRAGHLARHRDHGRQVAGGGMVVVHGKRGDRQVPGVADGDPGRAQPVHQASRAQRRRRTILPGVMRTRTARHPDHGPACHR